MISSKLWPTSYWKWDVLIIISDHPQDRLKICFRYSSRSFLRQVFSHCSYFPKLLSILDDCLIIYLYTIFRPFE